MSSEMHDSRRTSITQIIGLSSYDLKAKRRIIALLGIALMFVILTILTLFYLFSQYDDLHFIRKQTHERVVKANEIMSALANAETGERGYLLTNDEQFLEPYLAVRDTMSAKLSDLRALTKDAEIRQHVERLASLTQKMMAMLASSITLHQPQGNVTSAELNSHYYGKQLMDAIREEIRTIAELEQNALNDLRAQSKANQNLQFIAISAIGFFTIFATVSAAFLTYRRVLQLEQKNHRLQVQALVVAQAITDNALHDSNLNLIKNRKQLKDFVQHSPASMAMFDQKMTYLAASAGWVKDYGMGKSDLTGIDHYALHTDIPEVWKVFHQQGMQGATLSNSEDRWTQADGTVRWLKWELRPWTDEDGAIGGIVISAEDISERKTIEMRIIENERRLDGVLNSTMDAIVSVDESMAIVLFNPAAEKMFGIPKEQALGATINRLVPTRLIALHDHHIAKFRTEGGTARSMGPLSQVIGIRAGGEEFPAEVTISMVEIQGKKLFTAILRDRTVKRKMEADLQRYQNKLHGLIDHQQRIKEEERTRIAREIHDELGSILTGVKANLSVVQYKDEKAGMPRQENLNNAVALLDEAVDTVRRIINDLRPSVLDHLGIWTALEWYAEQTEASSGIRCEVACDTEVAEIELDNRRSTAIFRIFQESVTNVTRHANATGIKIRLSLEEKMIRMEIEDNGVGIESTRRSNHKSWGIIGMKERVRALNGDIRFTDLSPGTLVVLRLPLEEQDV